MMRYKNAATHYNSKFVILNLLNDKFVFNDKNGFDAMNLLLV
jgi:hypothetical protein